MKKEILSMSSISRMKSLTLQFSSLFQAGEIYIEPLKNRDEIRKPNTSSSQYKTFIIYKNISRKLRTIWNSNQNKNYKMNITIMSQKLWTISSISTLKFLTLQSSSLFQAGKIHIEPLKKKWNLKTKQFIIR